MAYCLGSGKIVYIGGYFGCDFRSFSIDSTARSLPDTCPQRFRQDRKSPLGCDFARSIIHSRLSRLFRAHSIDQALFGIESQPSFLGCRRIGDGVIKHGRGFGDRIRRILAAAHQKAGEGSEDGMILCPSFRDGAILSKSIVRRRRLRLLTLLVLREIDLLSAWRALLVLREIDRLGAHVRSDFTAHRRDDIRCRGIRQVHLRGAGPVAVLKRDPLR